MTIYKLKNSQLEYILYVIKELELTYLISLLCFWTFRRVLHRPNKLSLFKVKLFCFPSSESQFCCWGRWCNYYCCRSRRRGYFGWFNCRNWFDFDGSSSWGRSYNWNSCYWGWRCFLFCSLLHCIKSLLCIIGCYFGGLIGNLFSL